MQVVMTPEAICGTATIKTVSGGRTDWRVINLADILNGTSFADTIFGSGGNDILRGFGGADVIRAGSGNDILEGGAGDDRLFADSGENSLFGGDNSDILVSGSRSDLLNGGTGVDAASYEAAGARVFANLSTGLATVGTVTDTLVQIENLIGGAFDDVLTGDAAANELFGGAGNDVLNGAGGADRLSAGVGNDRLFGAAGSDLLRGDTGNDVLDGGAGFNELRGESGIDMADYSKALGTLDLDLRSGALTGDRVDSLFDIENAVGTAGADRMIGDSADNRLDGAGGHDSIAGLGGADVLLGGVGADTLDGGTEDDLLIGGAGADLFVFEASDIDGIGRDPFASGADRIADFDRGEGDRIDLRGHFEATSFADLRTGASQFGTDTVLTVGADTIRLEDVTLGELSAAMFLL